MVIKIYHIRKQEYSGSEINLKLTFFMPLLILSEVSTSAIDGVSVLKRIAFFLLHTKM